MGQKLLSIGEIRTIENYVESLNTRFSTMGLQVDFNTIFHPQDYRYKKCAEIRAVSSLLPTTSLKGEFASLLIEPSSDTELCGVGEFYLPQDSPVIKNIRNWLKNREKVAVPKTKIDYQRYMLGGEGYVVSLGYGMCGRHSENDLPSFLQNVLFPDDIKTIFGYYQIVGGLTETQKMEQHARNIAFLAGEVNRYLSNVPKDEQEEFRKILEEAEANLEDLLRRGVKF